jgi:hypothetical protein
VRLGSSLKGNVYHPLSVAYGKDDLVLQVSPLVETTLDRGMGEDREAWMGYTHVDATRHV